MSGLNINSLKESPYRILIPNGVTFLSLACAIAAMLFTVQGYIRIGGTLIIVSYFLDFCDGSLARRLNASTAFGLQLDSLVDMVSFGTAPAILLFMYFWQNNLSGYWLWVPVLLIPLAGAFRLARFNLLPPKEGQQDSLGLTISAGGSFVALMVLTDLTSPQPLMPYWAMAMLVIAVAILMASRIYFPPASWLYRSKRLFFLIVVDIALITWWFNLYHAGFWLTVSYLVASLVRAIIGIVKKEKSGFGR